MSPRQPSDEYRKQQLRSLIGFGIYFKDQDQKIKCINVDLVGGYSSKSLNQSAFDSIQAFR